MLSLFGVLLLILSGLTGEKIEMERIMPKAGTGSAQVDRTPRNMDTGKAGQMATEWPNG
jgi:hypothetical protein